MSLPLGQVEPVKQPSLEEDIRWVIYTTNAIESLNSVIRKAIE